ncbi:MAG: aminotransferase class V-fold PLP-dependent enzyme, partial [Spirochaetales bacterium]
MSQRFVYMDYNATTPLRPEVKDAMVQALDIYANASSMHESGRRARAEIEKARASV